MHLSQAVTYTELTCKPGRSYYAKGGIIKMCKSETTRQAEADKLARDARLAQLKAQTDAFTLTPTALPAQNYEVQSAPTYAPAQAYAPAPTYLPGAVIPEQIPETNAPVKDNKDNKERLFKIAGLIAGGFLLIKGITHPEIGGAL